MLSNLLRALFVCFISFSSYSVYVNIESDRLDIYIHEDISTEDIDLEAAEKIVSHLEDYFEYSLDEKEKLKIYFSPDSFCGLFFPEDRNEYSGANVVVNTFGDIKIEDKESFDFLFCYSIAKQMVKKSIRAGMTSSVKGISYIFPLDDIIRRILFRNWIIEGIALEAAMDYSPKTSRAIARIKELAMNAFIKAKKHIDRGVSPANIFFALRSDTDGLAHIFANFISFTKKRYGHEKSLAVIRKMLASSSGDGKELGAFNLLVRNFSSNTFIFWWTDVINNYFSSSEPKGEYINIEGFTSIYSNDLELYGLKDNDLYDLITGEIVKSGISFFEMNNYGEKIYSFGHPSIFRDRLSYRLYKDGVRKSSNSRAYLNELYEVVDLGLRDEVVLNDKVVVSRDYGLKISSMKESVEGNIYFAGSKESESTSIYTIKNNTIYEIAKGHSLFYGDGDVYFISNDNDAIFRIEDSTAISVYKGPVIRAVHFRNSLWTQAPLTNFIVKRDIEESDIMKLSEKPVVSKEKVDKFAVLKRKSFHYERISPIFRISDLALGVSFKGYMGETMNVLSYRLNIYWSILDTLIEDRVNPTIVTRVGLPTALARDHFLTNHIELQISIDNPDADNRLELFSGYANPYYRLTLEPVMGFRVAPFFGIGIRQDYKLYCHFYYGGFNQVSYLPESKQVKLIDGRNIKEMGNFFIVVGLRDSFKFSLNLNANRYRFAISDVEIGGYVYYSREFGLRTGDFTFGTSIKFNIEIYAVDGFLNLITFFRARDNGLDSTIEWEGMKLGGINIAIDFGTNL